MSLKRSRKQMSKVSISNKETKIMAKKKMVQFNDDATTRIPPSMDEEEATSLWYTRSELNIQLEDSKAALASPHLSQYSLLVSDSYSNPHMKVQEYLNAFCAGTDSLALRGLECTLSSDLNAAKVQARKEHVAALLEAQTKGQDLYARSRQSSASAKLFAMRLGRADARWEEERSSTALELVQEQEEKERRASLSRSSSSSGCSEGTPTAVEPCTTVIVSPCSSPLSKQLQQVVSLPSPLRTVMALPEIVFGKFTQSTASA